MIQEIIIFFGILIISLIVKNVFLNPKYSGPFYPFILRFRVVGVTVHELAHYIMSLAVGMKPSEIKVFWRDSEGRRNPHGHVMVEMGSFLQQFLSCLAPLYISTWLIFLSIPIWLSSAFDPVIRIIAFLFTISLFLGAAPSSTDFRLIGKAFTRDYSYGFYQIFLIFISTLILFGILIAYEIVLTLDVFYYLGIAGIYLILKFSFIGVNNLFDMLATRDYTKPQNEIPRRLKHRRYRPKKPKKLR